MNGSKITLPKKVFKDFVLAAEDLERAQSKLEDYILSRDKGFISRMRKIRAEHRHGRFADWAKIKAVYGL